MPDEITPAEEWTDRAHAEMVEVNQADNTPAVSATSWHDLTDSQKLDVLNMKVDSIGTQTSWIGQTLSGIIDMVGKVSPMDIFKMMRGGK